MQELAADPELKFDVIQTHTVVQSAVPAGSTYCSANVCCAPDELLGITDTVVGPVGTTIVVLSALLAAVDPPPDTLTVFTCGEVAFAATLTVAVIAG
jgi:hypothetical protein